MRNLLFDFREILSYTQKKFAMMSNPHCVYQTAVEMAIFTFLKQGQVALPVIKFEGEMTPANETDVEIIDTLTVELQEQLTDYFKRIDTEQLKEPLTVKVVKCNALITVN